jgi:hypothetical protein
MIFEKGGKLRQYKGKSLEMVETLTNLELFQL